MLDVIRFSGNVLLLRKKEHITDCADDDTAGIDDHPQSDIGGRYRRREKEQRYAILEYAACMTTLCIVKTTFMKRRIHGWEYAVCMTTLSIVKTTLIYVVYMDGNTPYVGRHCV